MNKETLKALKGSIVKWEKIVTKKGLDLQHIDCPLCFLFNAIIGCEGCLICAETGSNFCSGTPYVAWSLHQDGKHFNEEIKRVFKGCQKCKELAQDELDFLKSLLPKVKP